MAIQFKRGTGTANDSYTGLAGEFSIDLTNELIRVHDGTTAGGVFSVGVSGATSTDLSVNYDTDSFTVTSSTGTGATVTAATGSQAGAMSSVDKTKLDGIDTGAEVNRDLASTVQAEAGTDNTTVMTPLRTFEALAAGNWSADFGTL